MNLTVEAISNNVSALPVSSVAQTTSGQGGSGGFAATLAEAQGLSTGLSTVSSSAASEQVSEEKIAGSAGTDLSAKGGQNVPLRKPWSGAAPTRANAVLGVANNAVVPGSEAVQAGALAWLGAQMSQVPAQPEAASIQNSSGARKIFSLSRNAQAGGVASASVAQPAAAVLRSTTGGFSAPEIILPATVLPATSTSENFTSANVSANDPSGEGMVPEFPSSAPARGGAVNSDASQRGLPSISTAATGLEENAQPDALSTIKLPASDAAGVSSVANAPELHANSVQAGIPQAGQKQSAAQILQTKESVLLAYNAKPDALPFTTAGATADKNALIADSQATVQESAGPGDLLAAGAAQFTPQPSQVQANIETAPRVDVPILLADVSVEPGPGARTETSSSGDTSANPGANLNPEQEDGGEAEAPAVAPQGNAPAPAEVGNLFSESASAPKVVSPILTSQIPGSQIPGSQINSQVQALAGRAAVRAAASKTNAEVPSASAANAGVKTSTAVQAGAATEAESGSGSPGASQSPFSVFFSSSGPGTESAASTLPKMILPVATAAGHSAFTAAPGASAANPQIVGSQSNSLPGVGPQPIRDSLAGTAAGGTGSLPAVPAVHSEPAAATASTVVAQAAAAPATGQTGSPVLVLAAGQASVAGDPAPKPEVLPPATSGNPGAATGAVPVPATLAPGPVQMAQMVTRVGQSEMRVGLNTTAFGNVEVRTVVHASDVGLTIGSEKGDLRGMLANEMPAIANTLQQQNLRLNNVNFMQGFGGSSNSSGGGDSQPRSFVPQAASANYATPTAVAAEDSGEVLPPVLRGGGNTFSILA